MQGFRLKLDKIDMAAANPNYVPLPPSNVNAGDGISSPSEGTPCSSDDDMAPVPAQQPPLSARGASSQSQAMPPLGPRGGAPTPWAALGVQPQPAATAGGEAPSSGGRQAVGVPSLALGGVAPAPVPNIPRLPLGASRGGPGAAQGYSGPHAGVPPSSERGGLAFAHSQSSDRGGAAAAGSLLDRCGSPGIEHAFELLGCSVHDIDDVAVLRERIVMFQRLFDYLDQRYRAALEDKERQFHSILEEVVAAHQQQLAGTHSARQMAAQLHAGASAMATPMGAGQHGALTTAPTAVGTSGLKVPSTQQRVPPTYMHQPPVRQYVGPHGLTVSLGTAAASPAHGGASHNAHQPLSARPVATRPGSGYRAISSGTSAGRAPFTGHAATGRGPSAVGGYRHRTAAQVQAANAAQVQAASAAGAAGASGAGSASGRAPRGASTLGSTAVLHSTSPRGPTVALSGTVGAIPGRAYRPAGYGAAPAGTATSARETRAEF